MLRFVARGKERTSTITAVETGRALTLRSAVGGVTADYTYTVQPAASGDTSIVGIEALVGTRGIMTLLAPVIRGAIAREDGVQLANLKAWVEDAVSQTRP